MRPYDSEDGTRSSRVKKTAVTWVLRSGSTNKTTDVQEQHRVVDLDAEENVADRVAKLHVLQAGPRRLIIARALTSLLVYLQSQTSLLAVT